MNKPFFFAVIEKKRKRKMSEQESLVLRAELFDPPRQINEKQKLYNEIVMGLARGKIDALYNYIEKYGINTLFDDGIFRLKHTPLDILLKYREGQYDYYLIFEDLVNKGGKIQDVLIFDNLLNLIDSPRCFYRSIDG